MLKIKPLQLLTLFFNISVILLSSTVCSQTKDQNNAYRLSKYALEKYGTNDFLVNGWKYYPDHFNAIGNPNFNNMDWSDGTLTMRGETFENNLLVYNIQMDEVALMIKLKNSSTAFVMLNKDFVESFSIGEYQFINSSEIVPEIELKGYIEILYTGNFIFIIKHHKNYVANFTSTTPNGSISKQVSTNYILKDGVLHKINSKKTLINYFEVHKKQIKKFMKQHKIRFKQASNDQLKQLMNYCDAL